MLNVLFMWSVILLVFIQQRASASFVLHLRSNDLECYILRIPNRPSVVTGNYDILHDDAGADVIKVTLETTKEPFTALWKSNGDLTEESFSVSVNANTHVELCFAMADKPDDDDVMSNGIKVGFNVRVHSAVERTLPEGENGPDSKRALDLISHVDQIVSHWQTLLDHFDFLRNREAQHTQLTSQILSRVMTWTVIESVLVIGMAVGQVLYWRKFFEQKRYL